jgi:HlyD family secretion protein
MTEKRRRLTVGAGVLASAAIALAAAALPYRGSSAENAAKPAAGPLQLRGFTDVGDASAIIASEYGGSAIRELRVKEGQEVKRGDIVAVLSTYPTTEIALHLAEAQLEKAKNRQESLAAGVRVAESAAPKANGPGAKPGAAPAAKKPASDEPQVSIPEQEEVVKLTDQKRDLKVLEMQRSGFIPEEQALNTGISQDKSAREHARLKMLKEQLASDLAEAATDVQIRTVAVEQARLNHERSVVRSPLNGVVTQIWRHPGESLDRDICQVVDMSQVRVVVDLDERLINRVSEGEPVDVVFRGDTVLHKGKVARVSTTVSRMKSSNTSGTGTNRLDVVKVDVTLDDPSQMPRIVGREATVTFR